MSAPQVVKEGCQKYGQITAGQAPNRNKRMLIKVKKLFQKGFASVLSGTTAPFICGIRLPQALCCRGAFDDFVEFPTVQSDAQTLWAVINFHLLALGEVAFNHTSWT